MGCSRCHRIVDFTCLAQPPTNVDGDGKSAGGIGL
jgi:hypothetical protein